MKSETWHKAVEGYLGSNKLSLVVEPAHVQEAMKIYQEMDQKKYWKVSIADTESIEKNHPKADKGALSEEVIAKETYVQKLVDYLLGHVIKCESVEELCQCRIGVTAEGLLYKNFQLKRLNPVQYTRNSYIGENSLRQRMKELEKEKEKLFVQKEPLEKEVLNESCILDLESLSQPIEEYLEWQTDMERVQQKQEEKEELFEQLEQLKEGSLKGLEIEKDVIGKNRKPCSRR